MMKRDRLELVQKILKLCKGCGSTKNQIITKGNFNHGSAGEKLEWLVKRDLIAEKDGLYTITAKGNSLLSNLRDAILK